MAVTLYRCSKCRGLFNTVFEPLKMCRDCKLNQTSGGTSRASLRTSEGVAENEDVRIVEPEGDSMGGGKASAAIGGPIGDAQSDLSNAINEVTYQAFMARGQQNFSGGSQIRSPFQYNTPDYKFKFYGWRQDGERAIGSLTSPAVGSKVYNPNTDTFWELGADGIVREYDGGGNFLGLPPLSEATSPSLVSPPKPEPESSPHDAILKPSRKLKFAAE
jgi:hypothetical protein